MKYDDLPCINSIHGVSKITTEDLIKHSKTKEKEIFVSYTCLFLRGANPFASAWSDETIEPGQIKAILECAHKFNKHAEQLFHSRFHMFPIRYTPPGVVDKPGVVLREYDTQKYHDLCIYKVFKSDGSTFWEKVSYYTGLEYMKENRQYKKYTKTYNSIGGKIL
jgi:hypothetical protein